MCWVGIDVYMTVRFDGVNHERLLIQQGKYLCFGSNFLPMFL